MKLGIFSMSLNVKDIVKSKEFYEKLGFKQFGGHLEQNWLIMKNDETLIGLFQGMIPKNTLTFNPGWDSNGKEISPFTDVRELQKKLESNDIKTDKKVEGESGPGYFTITDPDGNPILIDQHR